MRVRQGERERGATRVTKEETPSLPESMNVLIITHTTPACLSLRAKPARHPPGKVIANFWRAQDTTQAIYRNFWRAACGLRAPAHVGSTFQKSWQGQGPTTRASCSRLAGSVQYTADRCAHERCAPRMTVTRLRERITDDQACQAVRIEPDGLCRLHSLRSGP